MKKSFYLALPLFILFAVGCEENKGNEIESSQNTSNLKHEEIKEGEDEDHEEEFEIADHMAKLQRYHHKLFLSGKSNNLDLISFYLHEMEEVMEEIAEEEIIEEGIDISANMKNFGLGQVEKFETQIKTEGFVFESAFNDLTAACNSCHQACKEPQIRIITPTDNPFSNQDFSQH